MIQRRDRQELDNHESMLGERSRCSLKRLPRLLMCLIFVAIGKSAAKEPRTWIGPRINAITMVEGNTLLDFVNQIREEIKKDKNSSIAVRIDVTDDDLRKHSAKLALKKIPAVVALSYAAEIGPYDFVFENGVWVLRNTPEDQRWYPDDVTTFSCQLATKEEMAALGFVESKDGVISVESGPKWPEEEWGAMERIGDGILLRAFYHEIESFRFLLQLHRRGYQVPKINSDDKGRGQLEPAPKREGDGEEKAIRK